MERTLLLVTGPGRSGTSTMAGILHHLGVHVPGPFLDANPSNPKGFYESRWSVQFHNRLLKRANVGLSDGRPEAVDQVRDAVRPRDREALRDHLAEITDGAMLTVVKDPRATWTLDLWAEEGAKLGLRTAVVVMMRPAPEVVGSRATHYTAGASVMGEAGYAIHNCAGWVNGLQTTERSSRAMPRTFVRYDALLAGWRAELGRVLTTLDLALPSGVTLDGDAARAVDEFVDPGLSRHRLTWDDVPMPEALRVVADRTWDACASVDSSGSGATVEAADAARARYEALYAESRALVHDHTVAEVKAARRATERRLRQDGPASGGAAGRAGEAAVTLARRLVSRLRRR